MPVTHAFNPSYLGSRDQEDLSLRPALASSSTDFISKITRAKWIGGMTHTGKCALCKNEDLSSNPNPTKKKEKEIKFLAKLTHVT
jgi:hypothetical protein